MDILHERQAPWRGGRGWKVSRHTGHGQPKGCRGITKQFGMAAAAGGLELSLLLETKPAMGSGPRASLPRLAPAPTSSEDPEASSQSRSGLTCSTRGRHSATRWTQTHVQTPLQMAQKYPELVAEKRKRRV